MMKWNLKKFVVVSYFFLYSPQLLCFEPDWNAIIDQPEWHTRNRYFLSNPMPKTYSYEEFDPLMQSNMPISDASYGGSFVYPYMRLDRITEDLRFVDQQTNLSNYNYFHSQSGIKSAEPEALTLLDALNSYRNVFPLISDEVPSHSSPQNFSYELPASKRMKMTEDVEENHFQIPSQSHSVQHMGFQVLNERAVLPSITVAQAAPQDLNKTQALDPPHKIKKRKRDLYSQSSIDENVSHVKLFNQRQIELLRFLHKIFLDLKNNFDLAAQKLLNLKFPTRNYSAVSAALRKIINNPGHTQYVNTDSLKEVTNAANRLYDLQKLKRSELTAAQKQLLENVKSLPIKCDACDEDYECAAEILFSRYKTGKTYSGLRYALAHLPERFMETPELKKKIKRLGCAAGRLYSDHKKSPK